MGVGFAPPQAELLTDLFQGGVDGNDIVDNVFTPDFVGATPVTIRSKLQDIVTPEMFYSSSDAGDWYPAFNRAQMAARVISCSPGSTYELSRAVYNLSNKSWELNGATLVNTLASSNLALQCSFLCGDVHPAMFNYANQGTNGYLPCYDVGDITVGVNSVVLVSPGNRSAFTVGQFVAVRTNAEITAVGFQYPLYVQFTKVTAIDTDGTIHLYDACLESMIGACISPIGVTVDPFMHIPWDIVENISIRNGTMSGRSMIGTRPGVYNGVFDSLLGGDGLTYLFSINAFVKCRVSRIYGNALSRLLEIKAYSQLNSFTDIAGVMTGNLVANPVETGEQANRNIMERVLATVAPSNAQAVCVLRMSGYKNTFVDSEFVHSGSYVGADVVEMPSSDFVGYGPVNNKIVNSGIVAGNATRTNHVTIGDTGLALPDNYLLDGVTMSGVTSLTQSVRITDAPVAGRILNCTMPYEVVVNSGAAAPMQSGNSVSSNIGTSKVSGSGTPEGVVKGDIGFYYARRDTADRFPGYVKTGGNNASTGWLRFQTLSGYAARGDADVTINGTNPLINEWTVSLTVDRYLTLFTPLSLSDGLSGLAIKSTTGGGGKLGVKSPAGAILAEIPDASKGEIQFIWNGAAWGANVVVFS